MSSLPTSAAWQTAPNYSSSLSAQPVSSENGPASTTPTVNAPAASSSEHDASDQAQQQDATGAEASHPTAPRRGTSKTEDSDATDAVPGTAASAGVPGTVPVPFQAVLNEVMPEAEDEKQQAGRQAADSQPVQSAKSAADAGASGATAGGRTLGMRTALDPTFQITKQAAPSGALSQKLADGEVAFAARVAQRAGEQATVNLRDPGAVIAESRFDSSRAQASGAQADAQAATTAKNTDAAATPQAKTQAQQPAQAAADSQLAGDGNANNGGSGQGSSNASDTAAGLRAASETQDDSAEPQPAQHAGTSLSAVAAPAADGGVRSAGAAKVSAESTTPQMAEPQGETTARAGESVREISLRLSNAEQGSVQVRLSERAGELHVTVRTPDTGLTRGLRDSLPDLVGRLQVNGYKAETWQPGGNGSNSGQNYGQDGRGNQRQGGGNPQQNSQQQQQQDEQTPQWASEMESSIQRSNSQWPASPTR